MSEFGTALDETPQNFNFLSPLIFKFQIASTPNLNFYVQNINLPGIHLPSFDQPNPLVAIPKHGDHIQYDDVMINFKVDEDFKNWLEIYNWIKKMGYPQSSTQHAEITAPTVRPGYGLYRDLSLIVMTSDRVPKFEVRFRDAFPTSISSLIFDVSQGDVNYVNAAATFKYTFYEFFVINETEDGISYEIS